MSLRFSLNLIVLMGLGIAVLMPVPQPQTLTPAYRSYAAYRAVVSEPGMIPSDPNNPRLLTDAQFAGDVEPGSILLGIYYGQEGWQMREVRDMERWQNKRHAVVNLIIDWCDTPADLNDVFDAQLANIWNSHNVPLITWEPFLCSPGQTPDDIEVRAATGAYDDYINRWADRLKAFLSGPDTVYGTGDDRRAYLRMGHEMNGDWFRWGAQMGGNSPADFVAMWMRVKGIFDGKGLDRSRLQWMWCVNHTDNGRFRAEEYWPGDANVDWVAIDGYNWGEVESWSNWTPPADVYDTMLRRLRLLTDKPLAIPEYGTTSVTTRGSDIAAKSQWLADMHSYAQTMDVRMLVLFNQDKETDWAVFGGGNGDETFEPPLLADSARLWQIAGAILLAIFVLIEGVFVTFRYRQAAPGMR